VARATAPIADTAVIVGCEPTEDSCLDAVAAALNVDQLLIARIAATGAKGEDATVEITAVTREARPVRQTFTVHAASRDADLAALEEQVPVMLEAGEARRDEPEPPPEPVPVPVPVPVPGPERRSSAGPLIVAGAGGALLVAGGVFWGLAASTQGEIDDAPTATAADLERLADLEDEARLRANVGNVLIVAGAVVAAGGVTWYLVSRRRGREVRVAPLVDPSGGGGVAIGGAW
jgi:hypothetical protein